MSTLLRLALGLLCAAVLCAPAVAQPYPNHPLKIFVTIPPGGAPDLAARIVAQKLSERLGQPIVIDNRPGSNGNVAGEAAAKSAPDGYTLLLGQDSLICANPALYPKMPFDTLKDLVPVANIAGNQFVMSINPSVPATNFEQFIAYAKKADPPLAYASAGNGSQHQLAMEMLKSRAGINALHVPYKGGAPAATATVAGETQAMFSGTSSAPQIKSGKLRGLAVTGSKRALIFPDLPTIAEFYPGYELTIWLGLFAPAGTPDPILARLRDDIAMVLRDPDVAAKLESAGGLQPLPMTTGEFQALIARDHAQLGKVIRDVGITLE